jgi:hypothetical protein
MGRGLSTLDGRVKKICRRSAEPPNKQQKSNKISKIRLPEIFCLARV